MTFLRVPGPVGRILQLFLSVHIDTWYSLIEYQMQLYIYDDQTNLIGIKFEVKLHLNKKKIALQRTSISILFLFLFIQSGV